MKCFLLLYSMTVTLCVAQSDPRVMENRYEAVVSLAILEDIFVSAYDSGNREYIKSMVLDEAVPKAPMDLKREIRILPPWFNTRVKVVGITEEKGGIARVTKEDPAVFSHLPEKVKPIAVIKYSYYVKSVEGEQWLTSLRFPVVSKGGKLYIGQFNNRK